MEDNFNSDFWQFWNPEIKTTCENSNNLCIAVFSIDGELLFANAGMKMLFMDTPKESFINPQFEAIVKMNADEYPLFNGLITFGRKNSSKNISVQAKIFKRENQLLIVGEVEVNQLVLINDKLIELNTIVTELQRKSIKEKKILAQSELKIKRLLSEKENLLREVHHRIKNNLVSIEGLLLLQTDETTNIEVKSTLQDVIAHIQSMRVLYDKLLLSKDYLEVSSRDYVESLIDSIVEVSADSGKVTIEKQIADFNLNTDKLIPIGMALNEILTNSFKYAFKGRDSGYISIILDMTENQVILTVQDNGIGLNNGFDPNNSSGFGSMILDMFATSCTIEDHKGTRSILEFDI